MEMKPKEKRREARKGRKSRVVGELEGSISLSLLI
jgi:hypothetical protein